MTHIAMLEVDDEGNPATWGDHVTDEEYAAAPETDANAVREAPESTTVPPPGAGLTSRFSSIAGAGFEPPPPGQEPASHLTAAATQREA